jgi:hypothetical protein
VATKALALGVVVLLLVPALAAAKSGVELSTAPDGLRAGQPWVVDLTAIGPHGPARIPRTVNLAIEIEKLSTGETHRFRALPLRSGAYRVRVVFPSRGTWSYGVTGLSRRGEQEWDRVVIMPATAGGPAPSGDRAGGFPWAWVVGLTPIVIALGLLFERRRTRARRS